MTKKNLSMFLFFSALSIFLPTGVNSDAGRNNDKQIFLNKDGSRIVLEHSKQKHRVSAALVLGAMSNRLLTLNPPAASNVNFFSVALVDIDNDGFGDIEQSGDCGNRVCKKIIYRFDPHTHKYNKFFSGAYDTVKLDHNFLVTGGGSGCCAYEYQIYAIERKKNVVEKTPSYIISVSNLGDGVNSKIECIFSDRNFKIIAPPIEDWTGFCEIYGKNYKLILP